MTTSDVQRVPNSGWDERVLVCRSGRLVDTFIVVSERYVVLVDTMASPADAAILLEIAAPYLPGRHLLVVNTHADWDHAWGNQLFAGPQATHPALIVGSRRCAERLRSPEEAAELAAKQVEEPGRFDTVQLTPPTLAFDGTLVIDGGDLHLELLPTPGHQPDHLALFLPEASLLLAGDAAELPFPLVNNPHDLPLLRASLDQMAALGADHVLYCHAPVDVGPRVLDANRVYFDNLEERCRRALARHGGDALLAADADVETLIGWPFAQAVPALWPLERAAPEEVAFYTGAHRQAIRAMCVWLSSTEDKNSA